MPRGGPHASAATTGGGELGSRRAARLRRSRPLNEARSATVASTPGAPTRHTRHPLVATDVRRSPFPPTSPVPRSPPVAPVHTFPGLPPVVGPLGGPVDELHSSRRADSGPPSTSVRPRPATRAVAGSHDALSGAAEAPKLCALLFKEASMARIPMLDVERATGLRRALLWVARRRYGYVPGVTRVLGVDLTVGRAASRLYEYLHLRRSSPLTRLQREMLATVVNGIIGG